jgi:ferredoxin
MTPPEADPRTTLPPPCLHLEPAGWRVPLPPGLSLLEAAQQAGIRLARSCRNGTCRACLCRMTAGQVHYRVEWPGLSREERAEGWVLPCVALAEADVVLQAPGAVVMRAVDAGPAGLRPASGPPVPR